jgi:hypothetical protein
MAPVFCVLSGAFFVARLLGTSSKKDRESGKHATSVGTVSNRDGINGAGLRRVATSFAEGKMAGPGGPCETAAVFHSPWARLADPEFRFCDCLFGCFD